MSEPDFSGVDPLRVPEARRRIAALEAYLSLPNANTADAVRLGRAVGLSRWQFQRLARVWRDHRAPYLIVAGKRGPSKRDYGIAPRAAEIAREIIERSDAEDPVTQISARIEAACRNEGLTAPSRPTIRSYVRAVRHEAHASGPPRLVIGRMWFHLPMRGRPANAMPTLLAAVLLPERRIIAHRVSTDPEAPPPVADLLADVIDLREPGAPARPLVMGRDDRRAAETILLKAGLGERLAIRRAPQEDLSHSLAGRLGALDALYRRARARPATRKAATRFEEPLDPADVTAAIEQAVATHNEANGVDAPEFDLVAR